MMWRKRQTCAKLAPNVHHNEQNPSDLVNILTNLSIKSWVGLTEDERYKLWLTTPSETENRFAFAKAIEQALKERNT
jgi:hypothetical protein